MRQNPYCIPGLNDIKIVNQIENAWIKNVQLTPYNILDICRSILNKLNEKSVTIEEVIGKSRKREIVEIRHMTAYHLREVQKMTWGEIGVFLGGRDHSTSINNHAQWSNWARYDHKVRQANSEFKTIFKLN